MQTCFNCFIATRKINYDLFKRSEWRFSSCSEPSKPHSDFFIKRFIGGGGVKLNICKIKCFAFTLKSPDPSCQEIWQPLSAVLLTTSLTLIRRTQLSRPKPQLLTIARQSDRLIVCWFQGPVQSREKLQSPHLLVRTCDRCQDDARSSRRARCPKNACVNAQELCAPRSSCAALRGHNAGQQRVCFPIGISLRGFDQQLVRYLTGHSHWIRIK